ncbi:hypothetical protein [Modestobacter roseus]|uniref:hypothetical protein n=1 Tax=Modestobacter roseus TaxID=1181884 RepID=UPI0034DFC13F
MRPRSTAARRTPPTGMRRPSLYLAVAAAGAVAVHVLAGPEPAAQAEAAPTGTVSVADALGLTASARPVDPARDLAPLEELAATRSSREDAQVAAQQAQAAADQAEVDRLAAEAEATAAAERAAAEEEAAAKAAAEAAAAAQQQTQQTQQTQQAAPQRGGTGAAAAAPAGGVARISNSTGSVKPVVQAAADAVVSAVPGAGRITLGGTRASAADPGGHPSGLALDYMVMTDAALGDAIVEYHRAHWAELGVDYLIWEQRMLSSPGGSWKAMADRGSGTANHYDHVHVNYRG